VVKAQVLAGGRGKGVFSSGLKGGVQLTKKVEEVGKFVELMVGHRLVTHQTGPEGAMVRKIMVAEAKDLARETYVAIILDRKVGGPVLMGSPKGGVDIEAVAETTPELIFREDISSNGPSEEQLARMVDNLGLASDENVKEQAIDQLKRLYRLFCTVDATQVEVNPFGVTPEGEVICFDAKINFDDNAAFRQKEIFARADKEEGDPRERLAEEQSLNYIGLEGNVGCLVNGAGLAMATMDLLRVHGGEPANFLDVGGTATTEQISKAFSLLLDDGRVKSIFVNIFGGIVKCDSIAEGILRAVEGRMGDKRVPLVIRLAGTNGEIARQMLMEKYPGRVKIFNMEDLDEAAKAAVQATRQ